LRVIIASTKVEEIASQSPRGFSVRG
jgi:hypothetical protein